MPDEERSRERMRVKEREWWIYGIGLFGRIIWVRRSGGWGIWGIVSGVSTREDGSHSGWDSRFFC